MAAQPKYTPDMYIGKKFDKLYVTGPEVRVVKNDKGHMERKVYCDCDCGNKGVLIAISDLFGRFKVSCGCGREEAKQKFSQGRRDGTLKTIPPTVHGDSVITSEFYNLHHIWVGMRRRCNNPNDKSYPDYGGKGIKVCPEWDSDYLNFKDWALKNGYIKGLSIDRIDNSKGYEPSNCRWSSDLMQANNKTNNAYVTVNGVTHTASEWAMYYGVGSLNSYDCRGKLSNEEVVQKFQNEGRPHKPFIIVNQLQYEKGAKELKDKERKSNE